MFKSKYTKYKTKYLNLVRQQGGSVHVHEDEGGADGPPLEPPVPSKVENFSKNFRLFLHKKERTRPYEPAVNENIANMLGLAIPSIQQVNHQENNTLTVKVENLGGVSIIKSLILTPTMTVNDIKKTIFRHPLAPEIKHFQAYRIFTVLGEGVDRRLIELKDPYEQIRYYGKDIIMVVKDERIDNAMTVVERNGNALNFVSPELKENKDVVMTAVAQNGNALAFASYKLKDDMDFAMMLIKRYDSSLLKYFGYKVWMYKDIVMFAVRQNGNLLKNASAELKNDKEVVMTAVKQNVNALAFASPELQHDDDIVNAAKK